LNGNLDISTGSIVNNYYSNKVAYWDVSGNLIQKDLEGYAKLTANTFTELQQINYGAGKYLQMYDGGVVSANTSINTKTAINANSFIFYNNGDKTNELICSTLTSNKITTLQDKSGTVALLSDLKIPTTGSWTPYSTVVPIVVGYIIGDSLIKVLICSNLSWVSSNALSFLSFTSNCYIHYS
jgi:hypothetical protein